MRYGRISQITKPSATPWGSSQAGEIDLAPGEPELRNSLMKRMFPERQVSVDVAATVLPLMQDAHNRDAEVRAQIEHDMAFERET